MTQLFSGEFLVAVLCIVNIVMFMVMALIMKRINGRFSDFDRERAAGKPDPGDDTTGRSAREIIDMLTPLVMEAKNAAKTFEQQIREKRGLTKNLNDALDSRIISINLLLSRAESLHRKLENQQKKFYQAGSGQPFSDSLPSDRTNVMDQQNQIIDLYYQKMDIDTIAQQLSLPKGEVQLVIDLKEKFIAMEQT